MILLPSTQRIEAQKFDLRPLLGPTNAVTLGWKFRDVLTVKDSKPSTVKFFKSHGRSEAKTAKSGKDKKHHMEG